MKALFFVVLCTLTSVASANVDCYLPSDIVSCDELRAIANSSEGGGAVRIREQQLPNGSKISLTVSEGDRDVRGEFIVPSSLPRDRALLRLQRHIRALQKELRDSSDEETVASEESDAEAEEEPTLPSYGFSVTPELGGSYYSAGITQAEAYLTADLVVSQERYVVRAGGGLVLQHYNIPDQIEATFWRSNASLSVARSVSDHWSVGVRFVERTQPAANLDLRLRGQAGVEWNLAPRVMENETVVFVRALVGAEYFDLASPNDQGALQSVHAVGDLTAGVELHFDNVDLSFGATARTFFDQPKYWNVGANAGIAFRPVPRLTVSLDANADFRNRIWHAPGDPDQLPEGAWLAGGGDFGPQSIYTSLSISYTLGDPQVQAQEQRWRD